jgi:putative aminopeptidase FrvX
MIDAAQRKLHEQILLDVTAMPTAAGRESRVINWIQRWTKSRPHLHLTEDKAGNLLIANRKSRWLPKAGKHAAPRRAKPARAGPLLITAHLDHPAFVVRKPANGDIVSLEFRGGVHDPYFDSAQIDIFDCRDHPHRARIVSLDPSAKPFKRVEAKLQHPTTLLAQGDVARWAFDGFATLPCVQGGLLYAPACDDLAAVAAALSTLDAVGGIRGCQEVGLLFTRAEEIGFIGAIAACKFKSVPTRSRLICLENSRSFPESPIGGGPIVRVGDKLSVFHPTLTNQITMLMTEYAKSHPHFKWQRKLMPGGTCEATTFSTFGYQSTCLCLALGNYHNMINIDGVLNGARPAQVGPEFISIDDYHGLIEMLMVCATQLDSSSMPSLVDRMDQLWAEHREILAEE